VTLLQDYEVVTHGVRRILQPFAGRVTVMDEDDAASVDLQHHVVLFDCYPTPGLAGVLPARLRPAYARGRVVAYSWETRAACVNEALQHGFEGFLAKSLTGAELASALERVAASHVVVIPEPEAGTAEEVRVLWPGDDHGLTERECEVISMVTHGVSNAEIAASLHLSINSVKSYVRSAYRKIGVNSRAQAVLWGLEHGFGAEVLACPAPASRSGARA